MTVQEAAKRYANTKSSSDVFIESHIKDFKAGVEFAQHWTHVEEKLPEKLVQVIVKLENGWHTTTWITENGDFAFNLKPTHWRYIDIE